jgi:aspartyl-tRNA(Asn)/glutamyl-tRNA(Gln) amidotransferase subunit B
MELVTEPVTFATNEEASHAASVFAKEYQLLLQYLGVSDANMEKGEFRVEANISLMQSTKDITELRRLYSEDRKSYYETLEPNRVEVKNLNSFKSAEKAIHFELDRMRDLYEEGRGAEVIQETRGWDEAKQITVSQRSKENAADYRYFPDPDIPKFRLKELFGNNYEKVEALPELPSQMRARYKESFGIKDEDIEVYINDKKLGLWFESMIGSLATLVAQATLKDAVVSASNFTTSDLVGIFANGTDAQLPDAQSFATVVAMYKANELSSRGAKDLILRLTQGNFDVRQTAEGEGLIQKNDPEALRAVAQKVIDENPAIVADFRGGKDAALMGLVGRVMKETKGSANPELTQSVIRELLG